MKTLIRTTLMGFAIVLGCAFGLLLRSNETRVEAQGPPPCTTPSPSVNGQNGSWPPNQDVQVNINPNDFNSAEIACLNQAFQNWNAKNGAAGNNSGVYFSVTMSTTAVATLNSATQAVSASGSPAFQVNRGTPGNGVSPAEAIRMTIRMTDGVMRRWL